MVGLSGSRSFSMEGVAFVESEPVRNDGVDAHRARGVSLGDVMPGTSANNQEGFVGLTRPSRLLALCLACA